MNAEIHVHSGARAGLVARLVREDVSIGRHPECALQLHPTLDLEVSARHAAVVRDGERWLLRDLDSRNGTFLNGRRLTTDTALLDGDQIRLGMTGPLLGFAWIALPRPAGSRAGVDRQTAAHAARTPTGQPERVRHSRRQTRRLRALTATLSLAVLLLFSAHLWTSGKRAAAWEAERATLQLRLDSLLTASEASARAIEGMLAGLTAALRESQAEVRDISARLRHAERQGDRAGIDSLRRRLAAATVALDRQQTAATLDFRGIERRNRRAVAKVFVEYEDGEVATATAFAVRPDATLITSRHVIAGADGHRTAQRIAVQFADSEQVWPARVLRLAADADLALLRAENIAGSVPTVQSLNLRSDTLAEGAPVALIGFPLGGETDAPINTAAANLARPVMTAGVVSQRTGDRLELRGYGAAGASGSPIFDGNGEVVAILYGGRPTASGDHALFSVPASIASRLVGELR